jgi:hypothetical protein
MRLRVVSLDGVRLTHHYSKGKTMRRASAVLSVCLIVLGVALVTPAAAQEKFPKNPVTIVVPYAAGGSHDLVARALQPQLEKVLGVPVIVENKPGGGSTIACNYVKAAPPDGYTLVTVSPTLSIIKYTLPDSNVRFDQFEPIAYVGYTGLYVDAPEQLQNFWLMLRPTWEVKCGNAGHGECTWARSHEQATEEVHPHSVQKAASAVPAAGRARGYHRLYDRRHAHMVKGSLKVLRQRPNGISSPLTPRRSKSWGTTSSPTTGPTRPQRIAQRSGETLFDALRKAPKQKKQRNFDMQYNFVENPEELGEYYKRKT